MEHDDDKDRLDAEAEKLAAELGLVPAEVFAAFQGITIKTQQNHASRGEGLPLVKYRGRNYVHKDDIARDVEEKRRLQQGSPS